MSDIDYVRIKDPGTGAELTYDTAKVVALGLQDYVIEKPALGPDGLPAPTKPSIPLGEALPGSEQDRRNQQAAALPAATPSTSGANVPGKDAGQTSASQNRS